MLSDKDKREMEKMIAKAVDARVEQEVERIFGRSSQQIRRFSINNIN